MQNQLEPMPLRAALKRLGIEDYGQRIFHSNSHGELIHIVDYIHMAQNFKGDLSWFRPVFEACVKMAEEHWARPESCFQHMPRLMAEMCGAIKSEHANTPP